MILTKISKKPHQLEKILAHRGGRMPGVPPPLDPALQSEEVMQCLEWTNTWDRVYCLFVLVPNRHVTVV